MEAHLLDAGGGPADAGRDDAGRDDAGLSDAGPFDDAGPDAARPFDAGPLDAGPLACGNGEVSILEDCDDGNNDDGDGCDATCRVEADWGCWGEPSFCGRLVGTCPDGFVFIPAGRFRMGCAPGDTCLGDGRESPPHNVMLSAYCISYSEVTVAAYGACTSCTTPDVSTGCNWGVAGREDHPVNCVDWAQSRAYCQFVSGGTGDLATEAQWERAARGDDDSRRYPSGDGAPSCGAVNQSGCGLGGTWPVDDGSPEDLSPFGVTGLAGNVWEWVLDHFKPDYYTTCDCGPCDRDPLNDCANPRGHRASRGGAYSAPLSSARCSNRNGGSSDQRIPNYGIRCVMPPPP